MDVEVTEAERHIRLLPARSGALSVGTYAAAVPANERTARLTAATSR
jgi:hypothetical protein